MMGISKTFLCLFLAFAIVCQAHGETFFDCLGSLYNHANPQCRNFAKTISCLKNVTASNDYGVENIDEEIAYLEKQNEEETCLVLAANGTCVQQQINICTNSMRAVHQNYTQICADTVVTFDCLANLNSTCSKNRQLQAEIYFYADAKVSCESGPLKLRMEEEKCYFAIDGCTRNHHESLNVGKFDDACKNIGASMKCLENIGEECDLRFIKSEMNNLNGTQSQCNSGVLTDVHSMHSHSSGDMDSSSSDQGSWDYTVPTSCTKPAIAAAKKCLIDLRPECVSSEQTAFYHNRVDEIEHFCEMNGLFIDDTE